MSNRDYDYFLKILLIGGCKVGKTCIISRLVDDTWSESYKPTIGMDMQTTLITHSGKNIRLQLWDIADFDITKNYNYIHAQGILLIYDCTDQTSFDKIWVWMEHNGRYLHSDVSFLLVGNKSDSLKERVITTKMAKTLADKYNISYIETSAKTTHNIKECFTKIIKIIIKHIIHASDPSPPPRCTCDLI